MNPTPATEPLYYSRHYQSCGHCHRLNLLTGAPVICPDCSHRADVPRFLCDCPICTGTGTAPEPVIDLDAIEADLRAMRARPSQAVSHYLLTSGTRHLGQFPTLQLAAASATALGEHQWLDLAIWGPDGELLAVWKDGELIHLRSHYTTSDAFHDGDTILDNL